MSSENAFYVEVPRYRSSNNLIFDLISLKPIAIGTISAPVFQPDCAIAIGQYAGYWSQGKCAVAVGEFTGNTLQGIDAVAVGSESGRNRQGDYAVAIGSESGKIIQGLESVAIGRYAGMITQGRHAISIGGYAGQQGQWSGAIAMGYFAGNSNQGTSSIAIGEYSGSLNQHANSIILNASGVSLQSLTQSALYVNPIRLGSSGQVLYYNDTTKEITKGGVPSGSIPTGTYHGDYLHWDSNLGSWSLGTSQISLGSFAGENNQGSASVALGFYSGEYFQNMNAIAVGVESGQYSQGTNAIAIGQYAGLTNQPQNSIVLNASGSPLSGTTQSALYVNPVRQTNTPNILFYNTMTKEIGYDSITSTILPDGVEYSDYLFWNPNVGNWEVGSERFHLGARSGQTGQSSGAIALGIEAGQNTQGRNAIAIGTYSGQYSQGTNAIAIGQYAGLTNQPQNSIVLNASGSPLSGTTQSALYVNPIRNATASQALFYNPSNKEITYSDPTFTNVSFQTYTYAYFQARDAVMGKFMLTDCADKDAFYRLRISNPQTLFEGSTIYDANPLSFDNNIVGSASISGPSTTAAMTLTVNSASVVNDYAARQTHFYAHYQPGKSFLSMFSFCFGEFVSGITKRVGFYDVDNSNSNQPLNGVVFEQTDGGVYQWKVYKGDGTSQTAIQNNWNVDPLNGTGASGINLSMTTNLLGFVDMEWLGVGRVRVGFYINGLPVICHTFNNSGMTTPYMNNPLLPIRYEIRKTISGSATDSMTAVCCTIISEGGFQPIGIVRSLHSSNLNLSGISPAVSSIGSCLGVRLKSNYPRAILQPITIEMISNLNGNAVAYYTVYLWRPSSSLTPSGLVWTSVSNQSLVEYNSGGPVIGDLYRQMIADTTGLVLPIEQGTVSTVTKTSFANIINNLLIAQSNVDKANRDIIVVVVDNTSAGPTGYTYSTILTWKEY